MNFTFYNITGIFFFANHLKQEFVEFFDRLGKTRNLLIKNLKFCRNCIYALKLSDEYDERSEINAPVWKRNQNTRFFEDDLHSFQRIWRFCQITIEDNKLQSDFVEVDSESFFENNESEDENDEVEEENDPDQNDPDQNDPAQNEQNIQDPGRVVDPIDIRDQNHVNDPDNMIDPDFIRDPNHVNDPNNMINPDLNNDPDIVNNPNMIDRNQNNDPDYDGDRNQVNDPDFVNDPDHVSDRDNIADQDSNNPENFNDSDRVNNSNIEFDQSENLNNAFIDLSQDYNRDLPGQQIYASHLDGDDKICELQNISASESKCCICRQFCEYFDSTLLTPALSENLMLNGFLKNFKGDGYGIIFTDQNNFDMIICNDCLLIENGFQEFSPRIFRKPFLIKHNPSIVFRPIFVGGDIIQKRFGLAIHNMYINSLKDSKKRNKRNLLLEIESLENKYESYDPRFDFEGARLRQYTGLDEDDIQDIFYYLEEFEHNRNFIRSLNIREAIITLFYKLRHDKSFDYLAERIREKRSTPYKVFRIKPETVSQVCYKIAYILGGRHPFANIKDYFAASFMDHELFEESKMGLYVNDFLGWDQPKLNDPLFLLNQSASSLRKLSSLNLYELRELIQNFKEQSDTDLKKYANSLHDDKILIVCDATYLFTRRPTDLENLRRLYSTHKGTFLSKLMIYCTSAGYLLQISGAWPGSSVYNDSNIIKIEAEHDKELENFIAGHINNNFKVRILCDRGFRDSRKMLLEKFGSSLEVVIPPLQNENISVKDLSSTDKFRNRGDKLSRNVANGARIVTMERNVVERMNKLLKDWAFFDNKCNLGYVFSGFQAQSARIIGSLLNRRFIRKNWISMDATDSMYKYNLYRSYYKVRFQTEGDYRDPKLTFVLKDRNFFNFVKKGNTIWTNVMDDPSVFSSFCANFPKVIHEKQRSRKQNITILKENDAFHFSIGDFHITRAYEYLRSDLFLENHFYMQVLRHDPIDILSKNLGSQNYTTQNLNVLNEVSDILLDRYPDWQSRKLNLVRFLVSNECSPNNHKVFIVYSQESDCSHFTQEPDAFFLNRVFDYFCDCMSGNRGFGCCSHIVSCLIGATLTKEEILELKYRRGRDILTEENYGRFNDPSSDVNTTVKNETATKNKKPEQKDSEETASTIEDDVQYVGKTFDNVAPEPNEEGKFNNIFDVPEDPGDIDLTSGEIHGTCHY